MLEIGVLLHPDFQLLNLAVVTVFEYANHARARPHYAVSLVSAEGGAVRASSGVEIATEPLGRRRFDTLLVVGDNDVSFTSEALSHLLRGQARSVRRLGAACTGAFHLAQAGLLDGRRATTHWAFADKMRREHPRIRVDEDRIFVHDQGIWTSAGATACIDLALTLVEDDLGPDVARTVAKKLVVYHRRSGGQSQHSILLDMQPRTDRMHKVLAYMKDHLDEDLSVDVLARVAHLSARQFSRAFHEETGQSPAKAVERLRTEAARMLLESGDFAVDAVARETGFGDPDRMRRAFLRAYGQPPRVIGQAARGAHR